MGVARRSGVAVEILPFLCSDPNPEGDTVWWVV